MTSQADELVPRDFEALAEEQVERALLGQRDHNAKSLIHILIQTEKLSDGSSIEGNSICICYLYQAAMGLDCQYRYQMIK